MVVPNPNRTAIAMLPTGSTKVNDVLKSRINGTQTINPRVKPRVNAPKSTPNRLTLRIATFVSVLLNSHRGFLA